MSFLNIDWEAVKLAFQFVPKLPVIEKCAAVLRDDEDFVDLVDQLPKLHETVTRLSKDDDVKAAIEVAKDLFKALAIGGGSKRKAVIHTLIKHGANEQEVKHQENDNRSPDGNPDAFKGGSDNANI